MSRPEVQFADDLDWFVVSWAPLLKMFAGVSSHFYKKDAAKSARAVTKRDKKLEVFVAKRVGFEEVVLYDRYKSGRKVSSF